MMISEEGKNLIKEFGYAEFNWAKAQWSTVLKELAAQRRAELEAYVAEIEAKAKKEQK